MRKGNVCFIIKPKIDSKGNNYLVSRIGLKRKVDHLTDKSENLFLYVENLKKYLVYLCR